MRRGRHVHGLADDHVDQLGAVELLHRHRALVHAVAQDRRPVGELEDLVQAVRHVDHARAGLARLADQTEQQVDLVRRQRRRRLVEHEHPHVGLVVVEGAGDGDGRPVDRSQDRHRAVDVEVDRELLQQPLRLAPLRRPVDEHPTPLAVPESEGDVLDGGELADDPERLVHELQTQPTRLARQARAQLVAVDGDLRAGVGRVHAGQHLDQGRLARAVLSEQGVDLAGQHGHRHVGEGALTGERLREVADLDRRGAHWCTVARSDRPISAVHREPKTFLMIRSLEARSSSRRPHPPPAAGRPAAEAPGPPVPALLPPRRPGPPADACGSPLGSDPATA